MMRGWAVLATGLLFLVPSALAAEGTLTGRAALPLEVDGGINGETARAVEKAGATVAVAGSFVFGSKDYAKAIAAVRGTQKRLG